MSRSKREPVDLLDALLADEGETTAKDVANTIEAHFDPIPRGYLIPIERIKPAERQPRQGRDEARIAQLANSIRENGVLQALLVRRDASAPGSYIVIAGEGRLLGARIIHGSEDPEARRKVATLPCVVREASDADAFADGLIENLVRKDLTRREVMDAVRALKDEYGWSVREIARRTGRDSKDLSELIRIVEDPEVAQLVADEIIAPSTAGHIVEVRDLALRGHIVAGVRDGDLRTGNDVQTAIAAARQQKVVLSSSTFVEGDKLPPAPIAVTAVDRVDPAPSPIPTTLNGPAHDATEGYGQVRDIPHLTIIEREQGNLSDPNGVPKPEVIPVSAHIRRLGASSEAERLAVEVITFINKSPKLDSAAILKLKEANDILTTFVAQLSIRG